MRQKILIADPDPVARETVRAAMQPLGVECVFASNEEEAFQLFMEVGPEALIADALLPRKGVFELLRRVRCSPAGADTPVFVTSALRATTDLRDEATKVWGARGVLSKPLDAAYVAAELRKALPPARPDDEEHWLLLGKVEEEGGFDRAAFPLVFSHAYHLNRPCRLAVSNGKVRKVITFANGAITFAQSNLFSETLARHLLDRGIVKEKAYQEAIRRAIDTGVRIGEAFVALKAADAATVDAAVRRNILEKVLDLFTWNEGWYRIIPPETPPAQIPGGPIPCDAVLWTVTREQMSASQLRSALTPLLPQPLEAGRPLTELPGPDVLGEAAQRLLSLCLLAPGRSIGEVLAENPEQSAGLLCYLVLTGFLKVGGLAQEPPPADPAMRKLLREAERKAEWMRGRNAFQVLGVPLDADDKAVAEAYQALSSRYGPEAETAAMPPAVLRALRGVHRALRLAYGEIMTAEGRKAHRGEIAGEGAGENADALRAEAAFRAGVSALRRRDWNEAHRSFCEAAALNPVESEYLMYVGIARMRQTTPTVAAALADAEEAIWKAHAAAPHNPEPLYQIGKIAQRRKDWERAQDLFEKALRVRPDHERARESLELVRARREKGLGDKLGSLFGGK